MLGPMFVCACEATGPMDMGERSIVDLGGNAGYASVWGVVSASSGSPRCSSASVPAVEGGTPGVCGDGGGGGVL